MKSISEGKCLLDFQVRIKHILCDRIYILNLSQDFLTMAEPTKLRRPKYVLKLDLSLSLIWVFNTTGSIVGFSFPTTRMRKTVYGPSEALLRLKDLVKGKVFFSGDNFAMFYKYLSDIDKGTFGKVAKYSFQQQTYAVKIIDKKATVKLRGGVDSLINEIMILQRVDDPHIIKLHEVYQDDSNFYLVLDHVNGVTMRQDLTNYKGQAYPIERTLHLFKQLLRGISYLHSRGVIHRDIKPNNIMVENDKLVIIDLGLSCFLGEQNRILPDCGTLGYMAPELLEKTGEYNTKVDMFSVGCVLYRLLTGKQAITGRNEMEISRNNKNVVVDLSQNQLISHPLWDILPNLLDPLPDIRMSAEEALAFLESSNITLKDFIRKSRRQQSFSKDNQSITKSKSPSKRSSLKQLMQSQEVSENPDGEKMTKRLRTVPTVQLGSQNPRDSPQREEALNSTSQAKTITSVKSQKKQTSQFSRPPSAKKK